MSSGCAGRATTFVSVFVLVLVVVVVVVVVHIGYPDTLGSASGR